MSLASTSFITTQLPKHTTGWELVRREYFNRKHQLHIDVLAVDLELSVPSYINSMTGQPLTDLQVTLDQTTRSRQIYVYLSGVDVWHVQIIPLKSQKYPQTPTDPLSGPESSSVSFPP